MKNIIAAAIMASMALATSVQAGSVVYAPEQQPVIVVEEAPMGSSGAWIVPLIAIGLICIVICGGGNDQVQGD